jgi:hypothetical protein
MGKISLAGSRIEAMIETLDSGSQRTYQVPSDSLIFFRVWPGVTAQAGQRGVNASSSKALAARSPSAAQGDPSSFFGP